MQKSIGIFLSVLFLSTLTSCGLLWPGEETPPVIPTYTLTAVEVNPIVGTEIPMPTEIPLPTAIPPTATPFPTATPGQVTMISAQVVFDNYILRTGPGRLFERIAMYDTGAVVSLIGREVSNNWVLVQTSENYAGWMNIVGLQFQSNILSLPVFKVDNAQVLQGHVYLPGRVAANGIGISIAPVENDLSASTDASTTNIDGLWAIYLPKETKGNWIIGPNSYSCNNSNAVSGSGEDCTLNGKLPEAQQITLPFAEELAIEFEMLPLNP